MSGFGREDLSPLPTYDAAGGLLQAASVSRWSRELVPRVRRCPCGRVCEVRRRTGSVTGLSPRVYRGAQGDAREGVSRLRDGVHHEPDVADLLLGAVQQARQGPSAWSQRAHAAARPKPRWLALLSMWARHR